MRATPAREENRSDDSAQSTQRLSERCHEAGGLGATEIPAGGELRGVDLPSPESAGIGATRAQTGRDALLERIGRGEQPPIIIVCGLSGSGKTTVIGFLGDAGVESAERLLPRPRREDDTPGDRTWTREVSAGSSGASLDTTSSSSIIWSDYKYTGYIGFRGHPLLKRLVKSDDCEGVAAILGRATEIASAIEAFQRIIPLQPVVVIRVDTPLPIINARLQGRAGATPEERDARLAKLEPMSREDAPQIEALARAWNLHSILNVSAEELTRIGLSTTQVQPATPENLTAWIGAAVAEAKESASATALDIATPGLVMYGNRFIPDSVLDVFENVLVPTFKDRSSGHGDPRWHLKGGLAVALYLPESRPVSPDIDFAVPNTPAAEQFLGAPLFF